MVQYNIITFNTQFNFRVLVLLTIIIRVTQVQILLDAQVKTDLKTIMQLCKLYVLILEKTVFNQKGTLEYTNITINYYVNFGVLI